MHYYSREDFLKKARLVTRSDIDVVYKSERHSVHFFPFPEGKDTPARPAIGEFYVLQNGSKQHTVGLCKILTGDEYFPLCGPAHTGRKWSVTDLDRRINEAVLNLPPQYDKEDFVRQSREAWASFETPDSPCSFWKKL